MSDDESETGKKGHPRKQTRPQRTIPKRNYTETRTEDFEGYYTDCDPQDAQWKELCINKEDLLPWPGNSANMEYLIYDGCERERKGDKKMIYVGLYMDHSELFTLEKERDWNRKEDDEIAANFAAIVYKKGDATPAAKSKNEANKATTSKAAASQTSQCSESELPPPPKNYRPRVSKKMLYYNLSGPFKRAYAEAGESNMKTGEMGDKKPATSRTTPSTRKRSAEVIRKNVATTPTSSEIKKNVVSDRMTDHPNTRQKTQLNTRNLRSVSKPTTRTVIGRQYSLAANLGSSKKRARVEASPQQKSKFISKQFPTRGKNRDGSLLSSRLRPRSKACNSRKALPKKQPAVRGGVKIGSKNSVKRAKKTLLSIGRNQTIPTKQKRSRNKHNMAETRKKIVEHNFASDIPRNTRCQTKQLRVAATPVSQQCESRGYASGGVKARKSSYCPDQSSMDALPNPIKRKKVEISWMTTMDLGYVRDQDQIDFLINYFEYQSEDFQGAVKEPAEAMPSQQRHNNVQSFCPDMADFSNPFPYLEMVCKSVRPHGACKIVPPKEWRQKTWHGDNITFKAGGQYIASLWQRKDYEGEEGVKLSMDSFKGDAATKDSTFLTEMPASVSEPIEWAYRARVNVPEGEMPSRENFVHFADIPRQSMFTQGIQYQSDFWKLPLLYHDHDSPLKFFLDKGFSEFKGLNEFLPTTHLRMKFGTDMWRSYPRPQLFYSHQGAKQLWYIPKSGGQTAEELKERWLAEEDNDNMLQVVQHPGEFLLLLPGTQALTISSGLNISESIPLLLPSVINTWNFEEGTEFSKAEILCWFAKNRYTHSKSILLDVLPLLRTIKVEEGVARLMLGNTAGVTRHKHVASFNDFKEKGENRWCCSICSRQLYLSVVQDECMSPKQHFCLKDGANHARQTNPAHCILITQYTMNDLTEMAEQLEKMV